MIRLKQAVVVEGKYDRIRLSAILDAPLIETGGFQIFRDDEMIELLRRLAKSCGVIIMTDSDFAGFRIRNYLKNKLNEGSVTHVYLPDVLGKEKRKAHASKEGLLGVEGFGEAEILAALARAGVTQTLPKLPESARITPYDLYALGLSGGKNSRAARAALLKRLSLPAHLSTAMLLEVLNALFTPEEFYALCTENTKDTR